MGLFKYLNLNEYCCSVMLPGRVYAGNPVLLKREMVAICVYAGYKIDILTYKIGLAKRG